MRVLVVTGKIMDESLSATTRAGIFAALSRHSEVSLIARFRRPSAASPGPAHRTVPVAAPRVPGVSMLWFHLSAAFKTVRLLRDERPDVVFVEPSAVPAVLLAYEIAPRHAAPVHLDLRTLPIAARGLRARLDHAFTAGCLHAARWLCSGYSAISDGAAAWLAERVRVPVAEVAVWGTGVDPERFDPSGLPSPDPVERPVRILYHGAIYLSRGLGTLLESLGMLASDVADRVLLTVLGSGPDSSALADIVARLGLSDSVQLAEAVPHDEVPAEIARHHAGILPLPNIECWRTSSPTKLLEYVAMARPVIATDIEAHRTVLGGEDCVVWAGGGSACELADAVSDLVRRLPQLTDAAAEARDRIVEANSWDRQAAVLDQALARLTGGRATAPRRGFVLRLAVILALLIAAAPFAWHAALDALLPPQEPVSWVPPARTQSADPLAQRLQDAIDDFSEDHGGIAVQAALITSGGAEWQGCAGYSDIGARVPATATDRFVLGSITKTFFATITMRQVEEGRLSLDDTMALWMPEVPESDRITIEMLMSHTSGLRSYSRNRRYRILSHSLPFYRWTPRRLIDYIDDDPPAGSPGSEYNYSNTNYVALGSILEQVTGRTAAELIQDDVSGPLGLTHTSFMSPPPGARMAVGYDERELGLGRRDVHLLLPESTSAGYTSAGAISTAHDVARFLRALFRGSLVSTDSLREMMNAVPAYNVSNPYQTGYGLGLAAWEVDGWQWWGHAGASTGYSSLAMHCPEHDVTFVVLTNLSSIDRVDLMRRVQDAITGESD